MFIPQKYTIAEIVADATQQEREIQTIQTLFDNLLVTHTIVAHCPNDISLEVPMFVLESFTDTLKYTVIENYKLPITKDTFIVFVINKIAEYNGMLKSDNDYYSSFPENEVYWKFELAQI